MSDKLYTCDQCGAIAAGLDDGSKTEMTLVERNNLWTRIADLEHERLDYEAVIRDLMDACDRMMGDSDLDEDESVEIRAMQCAAAILKGGA